MHPDTWVVLHFTPSQGVLVYGPYDDQAKAADVEAARYGNHLTAVIKCQPAYEDE